MKFWIYGFLTIVFMSSACTGKHGACNTYQYRNKIRTCQAIFFQRLANSSKVDPFVDCRTFYNEAFTCMNKSILQHCYTAQDTEMYEKAIEEESAAFGNYEFYCEYGGIPTIYPTIKKLENNNTLCKPIVNTSMVAKCENSFYEHFRNKPADPALCILAENIVECQTRILSYCDLDYAMVFGNTGMPLVNTAAGTSVHCQAVQDVLNPPNSNGDVDTTLHHPTSWDVLTPVLIIGILMLLALTVGFCHFAKKEARKEAEQKRINKEKISEKVQLKKSQENFDQPFQEGEELIQLPSGVMQERNEVSSI